MKMELFGFKIDDYKFAEAIKQATVLALSNKVSQVVTINPEMIEYASKEKDFAKIVNEAEMIIPDGIGVKIALAMNGFNTDRIPGIDFAYKLLIDAAKNNIPVAIIGAKEEVVQKAVQNLSSEINDLNIVFWHNGYFNNDDTIYNNLKEQKARLILVAMGSPRQEKLIYNAKNKLDFGLFVGIGGSLDVWSGMVKRAPKAFQKLGIEWLYRVIKEPQRIKRIFPTLPVFITKALMYKFTKKEK